MGFAVTTHYCGGTAVESKLIVGHEKLDCGMAEMDNQILDAPDNDFHFTAEACCDNTYKYLDTDDNLNTTSASKAIQVAVVIASFISLNVIPQVIVSNNEYNYISPPLVDRDILTLHQVFRI